MAVLPPLYEIQITPITKGPLSDLDRVYDIEFTCKVYIEFLIYSVAMS